jgi:hypothetical protein
MACSMLRLPVGGDVEIGLVPARMGVAVARREGVDGFQAERAAGAPEQVGKYR